jgi:hypothetical protein
VPPSQKMPYTSGQGSDSACHPPTDNPPTWGTHKIANATDTVLKGTKISPENVETRALKRAPCALLTVPARSKGNACRTT